MQTLHLKVRNLPIPNLQMRPPSVKLAGHSNLGTIRIALCLL
jgi:hypothetical protein